MRDKSGDVLFLHTPHAKGPRVRHLQEMLSKRGWLHGAIDGEFGPLTHQAVYRAKYWLGYLFPDHNAGMLLFSYLEGRRQPSVKMRVTARLRQRKAQQVPKGQKVVLAALNDLGTRESPPNSNIVKYSRWYGLIGSWCAMFVTFWWIKFSKSFIRGSRYAYVPFIYHDALAGRNHLTITLHPVTGDIPCYDWQHDATADHTGLYCEEMFLAKNVPHVLSTAVQKYGSLQHDEFWALEGNTAVGSDSDGGEVMLRKRQHSLVQAFVHPG